MLSSLLTAVRSLVTEGGAEGTGFGTGTEAGTRAPDVADEDARTPERTPETDGAEIDSVLARDEITPSTVLVETGLRPDDFLVAVVRHEGGRVWQGEIKEATGWSAATVSRKLSKLESDDRIQRRQMGRRKLVFLPEETPEALQSNAERYDHEAALVGKP